MSRARGIVANVVAVLAALSLLPFGAGDAKPAKARVKPSAPATCEPGKFRIIVDVGHTSESLGATSARNDPEFGFNLHLAKLVGERLKSSGFAATRVLVTEGKARPSLLKRVATANGAHADFFLSIHHDSVPDKLLEEWEFDGSKSWFSDRFSGHSLFVSERNPHFGASLSFARLLGQELKADGLHYASQYTLPLMGRYRHQLLDKDVGVYRYDGLVVLSQTSSAAVLLEAGSIINRDEEMAMNSPERQELIAGAVSTAMRAYCGRR
ncbi:N-acetylmuramoyl-L-alanine amidase [Bradyrhizobium sp. GCM10027634]|uniref:N-acetylmuramoyl-L-alanine amidase n=1 Tax=unclassified Bradyrhizobium TaxID=2631580 RepID=UPI00188D35D5|nr:MULTISPECIES: N-acetylmuramoyl-L-alanine amidase [unclassified Bradyrhizobium]MDN5003010.1 N-acetylmuramoyl-L-alanine amidase [Bradyrhizobium sp. WYCCWR 12677]QOZ48379.1 N-acetylmuramoyl-L-alanine amidase [Bradyrhizobium sp. CCBAU 53340]